MQIKDVLKKMILFQNKKVDLTFVVGDAVVKALRSV